ncbi:MAG: hypothetical protein K0R14_219 [Burkholderiales bacterium]|jgi:hypothetical protein|nr:hypothetical protein [Burkholderiales bacterium]
MFYKESIIGALLLISYAEAAVTTTVAMKPVNINIESKTVMVNPRDENRVLKNESAATKIVVSNLGGIDNNTADLVALKRKLEIEKAEAELKKISNGGGSSAKDPSFMPENAQTIVTGVAINQEGRKIAWLQFADGGSLTVNIGSLVGKYRISDITMTGVELSYSAGAKSRAQHVFLKRAYYAPEKPKQSNGVNLGFTPSPVITNANSGEMVPPIVPVR